MREELQIVHDELAAVVSDLQQNESLKEVLPDSGKNLLDSVAYELKEKEFRITVTGQFSSGKSTFLNALIGRDILPHGVTETTAALTYIHNVLPDSPVCDTAEVFFYAKEDKVILDLNKDPGCLVRYVTTSAPDVIREIKEVHVYVSFNSTTENLVLIDTPGLNGIAEGHRSLTLHEVRRSHASICLFHSGGLREADVTFLRILRENQYTFFYVENFIDKIEVDNGETYESEMAHFEKELRENLQIGETEPLRIYGISALFALVAQDKQKKKIYRDDVCELTDATRAMYWQRSRFEPFRDALYRFVMEGEYEYTFYYSLLQRIKGILNELAGKTSESIVGENMDIQDIPQRQNIQSQKTRIPVLLDRLFSQLTETLKQENENFHKTLTNFLKNELNNKGVAIVRDIKKEDFESMKTAIEKNKYARDVDNFLLSLVDELSVKFEAHFRETFETLMIRIEEKNRFYKIDYKKKGNILPDFSTEFRGTSNGQTIFSEIEKLESKSKQVKIDLDKQQHTFKDATTEFQRKKPRRTFGELMSEKTMKVRMLGHRPQVEYKKEEYYRDRKGIRCLLNFFGQKKETRWVPDYSRQREWDNRMNQIEEQYRREEKSLKDQQAILEKLEQKITGYKSNIQKLNSQHARIQAELDNKKRLYELEKKYARSEWLKKQQKSIETVINELFYMPGGSLYKELLPEIDRQMAEKTALINEELQKHRKEKEEEWIGQLDQMIHRLDHQNGNQERIAHVHNLENLQTYIQEKEKKIQELYGKLQGVV